MSATISTFEKNGKSFPTITLKNSEDEKFPFSFGATKARLILKHLDEIKKFVEENGGLD